MRLLNQRSDSVPIASKRPVSKIVVFCTHHNSQYCIKLAHFSFPVSWFDDLSTTNSQLKCIIANTDEYYVFFSWFSCKLRACHGAYEHELELGVRGGK